MDEVEKLIAQLDDLDPEVRKEAAKALGELKDTRALPALLGMQKETDWELYAQADTALAKILRSRMSGSKLEDMEKAVDGLFAELSGKHLDVNEISSRVRERSSRDREQDEIREFCSWLAQMKVSIVQRKNQLAQDKGILLDSKPKPPKKPSMYSFLRRKLRERCST